MSAQGYPPPDATREQVQAWERERSDAYRWARCASCGQRREDHGRALRTVCSSFVEPTVSRAELMQALGGKP